MDSVFFLVLRRMRAPLIVLVSIYAISVLGLTLVPGVDANGQPAPPLSFFHAFYFISYTATTIGFGEIPTAFSDGQRMWVTFCIYLTVVGWSYSIVTLLALLQDDGFKAVLVRIRFGRRVERMREPFFLVCGCGETGGLVCHTLDRLDQRFVVIERSALRVQELELEDFRSDVPAMVGDASQPDTLRLAGLEHPLCRGVLALTDDETGNLAVAMAARLLNPSAQVLARADSGEIAACMRAYGVSHILNPFEEFADTLAMGVQAPVWLRLNQLLAGIPGEPLLEPRQPPAGAWLVAGYGRFGREIEAHLQSEGMSVVVLDPDSGDDNVQPTRGLDPEALQAAGVMAANGLVAATSSDISNLAIAMTARQLKPDLFIAVRQNERQNSALFQAFAADLTMIPTRVVAQNCLAWLITPLLSRFNQLAHQQTLFWVESLCEALVQQCEGLTPLTWSVQLTVEQAPAVCAAMARGEAVPLSTLLQDSTARQQALPARCLLLLRGEVPQLLPDTEQLLQPGDQLLFAGQVFTRAAQRPSLMNENALDYVSGKGEGGWLWRRWTKPAR